MDFSENAPDKNRDEDIVNKIRSRINEVEELIEAMKSKLPNYNHYHDES